MRTFHLLLTDAGARLVAHVLVCPDARYASVRWLEASRLERRHLAAAAWPVVARELAEGWPKGLVPADAATARALLPEDQRHLQLQALTEPPIAAAPLALAAALDAYLHQQVVP